MDPTLSIPTVRELIAEYAAIEDRVRSVEAQILGGSAPPLNPELVRLAERERHVMAMLRRHHATPAQHVAEKSGERETECSLGWPGFSSD